MSEKYVAEAAVAAYEAQQMKRGEGTYLEGGDFQEVSHQPEIRRMKGYIPEASFNDAVRDLTDEQAANQRAFAAYQEMMAQGQEALNHDDRYGPAYEYDLTGQGFQEDESDFDSIDENARNTYEEEGGEEEVDDDTEDYVDIWEDVVSDDPSTWPSPEDVVEQLKEVSETFRPDPDAMRQFREIADYAESKGDYEYTSVCRAIQQVHAGNLSIAQAYNKVVADIGVQEALRIWVHLEANGVISF